MITWLLRSSADPKQFSLMIRGAAVVGLSLLLKFSVLACGVGLLCLGIDEAWVNIVAESIEIIAFALALIVGAIMTMWGAVRKLDLKRWAAPKSPTNESGF